MSDKLKSIKTRKPFKLFDMIFCLVLAAFFTIGIAFFMPRGSGTYAEIYNGNTLLAVMPLNKDHSYIYNYNGHYNKIVVSGGKISVEDSDCQDKLCINFPPSSVAGSTIICLPHELIIVIKGDGGVDESVFIISEKLDIENYYGTIII